MKKVICFVCLATMLGCAPNLSHIATPISILDTTSAMVDMPQAIRTGLTNGGWWVTLWVTYKNENLDNSVTATIESGGHSATVVIYYNATSYRIEHKDSSPGLCYRRDIYRGELIHKRYNFWVERLDMLIKRAVINQVGGQAAISWKNTKPLPQPPRYPSGEPIN
jgi:hypothetical protein